jgi:hypothetical protein
MISKHVITFKFKANFSIDIIFNVKYLHKYFDISSFVQEF